MKALLTIFIVFLFIGYNLYGQQEFNYYFKEKPLKNQKGLMGILKRVKGGAACYRCECKYNEGVWYTNAGTSDLQSQINLYCVDGPGSDGACFGMSQIECNIIMQ